VSAVSILVTALAVVSVVAVSAVTAVAVYAVENWQSRALRRTALACELDRARQGAALEEITRHRARIERDLDAMHALDQVPDPVQIEAQVTQAVAGGGGS
jgi:hypothetical protein